MDSGGLERKLRPFSFKSQPQLSFAIQEFDYSHMELILVIVAVLETAGLLFFARRHVALERQVDDLIDGLEDTRNELLEFANYIGLEVGQVKGQLEGKLFITFETKK